MISAQSVIEILMDLPDNKDNPHNDNASCVYTDPYDYGNHCIAGEVIDRLGYRLPSPQSDLNHESIMTLLDSPEYTLSSIDFDPLAYDLLCNMQSVADSFFENIDEDGNLIAWGRAKDYALNCYLMEMLDIRSDSMENAG